MVHRTSVMVVLSLLVGCGAVSKEAIQAKAATDFGCNELTLESQSGVNYVEKVTGCGRENIYARMSGGKEWASPLDRAAFEMSCPKESLTTTVIDGKTVGVSGCDKKAVYTLVLADYVSWKWVLNSTSDGPPSPDAKAKPEGTSEPPSDGASAQ